MPDWAHGPVQRQLRLSLGLGRACCQGTPGSPARSPGLVALQQRTVACLLEGWKHHLQQP